MFEKPQYLTPNGYKRMASNPYRKQAAEAGAKLVNEPEKKKLLTVRPRAPQKKKPQFELSDKAALLIAQALKGMLGK